MASVNKVILVGNLGADPETRYTPNNDPVCNFRIATTDTWKDKVTGEKRESTEWHRIVMYRGLADVAAKYLRKGSSVYIEGRLKTRKWQDKDGQDRYTTEIEATEMKMLGGRSSGGGSVPYNDDGDVGGSFGESSSRVAAPTRAPARQPSNINIEDDDIPF